MKFQRLLLICCCVIIALDTYSQEDTILAQVVWGDRIPLKGGYHKIGFVGDLENGFLQISIKNKNKVGFTQISGNLKYQNSRFESVHSSVPDMFANIIQIDKQAYALYNVYDKKKAVEKLFMQRIDIRRGGLVGNSEELIATKDKIIETVKYPGAYDYTLANKYTIVIPEHENRILVFYRVKQEETKNTDKIIYQIFDRDWKFIWSKEVFMPRPRADVRMIGHRLVNDHIFMFVRTKSGAVDWNTKQPEFDRVSVLHISDDATQPKEYPLEFEGTNLYDITLGIGKNNQILLAGFFKTSRIRETFVGYFTAVFNPEKCKLEHVNMFTFNNELVTAFENPQKVAKLNKAISKGEELGMPDLKICKVIHRADGGWYVVGEQQYFYVQKDNRSRSIMPIYHYWYMDMIVASVGNDGIQEWIVKVPKKQHFINTTFGAGVSAFAYENDIYLFHLDHVHNRVLNDTIERMPYYGTENDLTLMCVKINRNGIMERRPVFDTSGVKQIIAPASMEEMKPGVLLIGNKNILWESIKPGLLYLE